MVTEIDPTGANDSNFRVPSIQVSAHDYSSTSSSQQQQQQETARYYLSVEGKVFFKGEGN